MGARPSSFKKAGGFLSNVTANWSDYEFTIEKPGGGESEPNETGFQALYNRLTFIVDGADAPQQTSLFAGNAAEFEISDDGKTLTPLTKGGGLRQNADFSKFVVSAIDHGFPVAELPEDDPDEDFQPINYEPMLNYRYQLVQTKSEALMAKAAKEYRKSNGKYNELGQKKGKDGKYYNQTFLEVESAIGRIEAPAKGGKKAVTSAATKTSATKAPKGPSLAERGSEVLKSILEDAGGSIDKSKLPGKINLKLGSKDPQREELRKLIYDDEFLEAQDGVSYDKSSKKQTISLITSEDE